VFQIFALGPGEAFAEAPGRSAVVDALRERTLASGYLVGTYQRPDGSIKTGQAAAVVPLETA